ncbi:hypothetical protein [Neolewinella aurantiaca]|nr:hypothetical protein [Neolewinella aurantiaca]
MSNSNNLKKGLNVIELEDRLETVQLAVAGDVRSDRCDRCSCEETVSPE